MMDLLVFVCRLAGTLPHVGVSVAGLTRWPCGTACEQAVAHDRTSQDISYHVKIEHERTLTPAAR